MAAWIWLMKLLWGSSIMASWLFLALYRSSEYHGPDKVGNEVVRFVLPLVISLAIALGMFVWRPEGRTGQLMLVITIGSAVIETAVYLARLG